MAEEADLCAVGQKALDCCKADTAAAAADDYYFAFEFVFKHVKVLPFSNKYDVDRFRGLPKPLYTPPDILFVRQYFNSFPGM